MSTMREYYDELSDDYGDDDNFDDYDNFKEMYADVDQVTIDEFVEHIESEFGPMDEDMWVIEANDQICEWLFEIVEVTTGDVLEAILASIPLDLFVQFDGFEDEGWSNLREWLGGMVVNARWGDPE